VKVVSCLVRSMPANGQALSGLKSIFIKSQSIKDIILERMPNLEELGLASTNFCNWT